MIDKAITKAPLPKKKPYKSPHAQDRRRKASTSILPNRDATHLVRRVDVGLGLEQRRDNSFFARL